MNSPTKSRAKMRAQIRDKNKGKACGATASKGVLVCVLEHGHLSKGKPHATATHSKAPQLMTWCLDTSTGKILVKSFMGGKAGGEWTEEAPQVLGVEPEPEAKSSPDTRDFGAPCRCWGDRHQVEAPACVVQPHDLCVCEGTEYQSHLIGAPGCTNQPTNLNRAPTFTLVDGIIVTTAGVLERRFNETWERLEIEGACDAMGGAEYSRLRDRWLHQHSDVDIETFIRAAASEVPDADSEGDEEELKATDVAMEAASEDLIEGPESERDIKPVNMIASTGETIACRGRVYRVHPEARRFETPEAQYRELVESMRRDGQKHDVELLDDTGEVIDGCSRLRACEELGIDPRTKTVHVEPGRHRRYVIAVNVARRHMDESMRAIAAADLATIEHGTNQHTRGQANVPLIEEQITQDQAAEMLNVSPKSVRNAARVKNSGTPELEKAMRSGRLKVSAAAELVKLNPAKQNEYVERLSKGGGEVRAGKVRSLVRQEMKREVVQNINRDLVRPMPMGPFGLIVVDYAWKFENSDGHEGSRGHLPYPPMEWDEILAHSGKASKRAGDDCILGLWVVNAYLLRVHEVLARWDGFVDMETPITWDKVHMGMGTRGPRHQTEHLILASKGNPKHTLNEITTLFREPRQVGSGGHSKKPDKLYDLLAKHCAGPRLELFAIGKREGWETWGAEADKAIATERKKSKILTATDERLRAS